MPYCENCTPRFYVRSNAELEEHCTGVHPELGGYRERAYCPNLDCGAVLWAGGQPRFEEFPITCVKCAEVVSQPSLASSLVGVP